MEREMTPGEAFEHWYHTWFEANRLGIDLRSRKTIMQGWYYYRGDDDKKKPTPDWIRRTLDRYCPGRYEFREVVIFREEPPA